LVAGNKSNNDAINIRSRENFCKISVIKIGRVTKFGRAFDQIASRKEADTGNLRLLQDGEMIWRNDTPEE